MFIKYGYLTSEKFITAFTSLTKLSFPSESSIGVLELCQSIDSEFKVCLEKLKGIEAQFPEESDSVELRTQLAESDSKIKACLDFGILAGLPISPEALVILKPIFFNFPELKDPQTDLS
jgi:hypothetical protein